MKMSLKSIYTGALSALLLASVSLGTGAAHSVGTGSDSGGGGPKTGLSSISYAAEGAGSGGPRRL